MLCLHSPNKSHSGSVGPSSVVVHSGSVTEEPVLSDARAVEISVDSVEDDADVGRVVMHATSGNGRRRQ